jgi:mono/diheme cytochrome c family protein
MQLMGTHVGAVVSAALATTLLRFLWDSTLPFTRPGLRLSGNTPDEHLPPNKKQKKSGKLYAFSFLTSLLTAFVLDQIIRISGAGTALFGMKVGASMWLGFVSTLPFTTRSFSRKPRKPYLIETGYPLVSFLMMGAIIASWPRPSGPMGTELGFGVFQERCMRCHGDPNASPQAPDPSTLRRLTPEAIYAALTKGVMRVQGQGLNDEEKRRVAEWLGGRPLGSLIAGDAKSMKNHCSDNAPLSDLEPAWNGWGSSVENTRFQPTPAAGISAEQVPRLTLKWAFGYPNGINRCWSADACLRTGFRWDRYWLCLFAGRVHWVCLLVF